MWGTLERGTSVNSQITFLNLSQKVTKGRKVLASDGEDVSTPELVRRIAYALGRPARLAPVPEGLMRLGGRMIGKGEQVNRLCGSLEIDSSKVRRLLGWKPVCTMEEEMKRVAEWYWSAPRLNTQSGPVQRGRDYADEELSC